jgi:hypothetical protein
MENNIFNHKEKKSVLLLIILFLISFLTLAQNNIVKIEHVASSQTEIISSKNRLQLKSANSFLQISGAESILQNRPENLTLQLGNILSVDNFSFPEMVSLDACNVIDPESKLVMGTKEGDKTVNVQIATYKGLVGEDGWISLSFTQNGMVGLLSFNGSTHVIQPTQSQTINLVHNGNLFYEISNQDEAGGCGVDSESLSPQIKQLMSSLHASPFKSASIQLAAKVAVETDYETYVSFGNDSVLTTAYLLNIIASVSQIYEREVNIKLEVAYCRVWTIPEDPYSGNGFDLWDELSNYWIANMQHIDRDVTILIVKDPARLAAGMAALDALCDKERAYIISGNSFVTVAHELGHILGSPHTHNCSWPAGPNGTLAPIDQCASVEGECGISEIIPQEGTIMSYCPARLEAFHPLVRNLIRASAESNPCMGDGTETFNTVSGKVILNDIGLANVDIKASRGDGKDISTKTTADGSFSLSLPNKAYNITADRDSFLIDPVVLSSSRSVYVTVAGVNVTDVNYQAVKLPPDKYEPDNNVVEAINITTNGDIQDRTIHNYFDADIISFNAVSGQTYTIMLHLIQGKFMPTITLLDTDGVTSIANAFIPPFIEWKAEHDGTYFIRIYGDKGFYGLSVSSPAITKIESEIIPLKYPATDWGDFDNDGDLDLLVAGMNKSWNYEIALYRNDNGSFERIQEGINQMITTNFLVSVLKWFDLDNDGDLDAFVAVGEVAYIYINEEGSFPSKITIDENLVRLISADFGDFDNDGDLDILIQSLTDWKQGEYPRIQIYRNDKNTFVKTATDLQGVNYGKAIWGDYNGDGDLDIFVGGTTCKLGEACGSSENPFFKIYRNENGNFYDSGLEICPVAGIPDFNLGDYDGDGDLDIVIAGQDSSKLVAKIYRNDLGIYNDSNFELTGVRSAKTSWGDFDNDGDLDLIITGLERLDMSASSSTKLYINNGNTFEEWPFNVVLPDIIGEVNFCDFDEDNDLDLLLIGETPNRNGQANLLRNEIILKNNPPSAPTGLTSIIAADAVTLSWILTQDDKTPSEGLSYNLRIGTSPGGVEILAPMSDLKTGFRQIVEMGNASHLKQKTIGNLTPKTYYWSVQAIDNSFVGSAWAQEQSFNVTNTVDIESVTFESSPFKIFPNPTTGIITLDFDRKPRKKIDISVLNSIGSEEFRTELSNTVNYKIDLSNQVSGIYFLKVIVDNQQYINKLVLRKE